MKKVIIIGCPGSGKSTFARALSEITKLPLHYLDMMYWNADGTQVEKAIFLSRLADAMAQNTWIIDGNYGSTMERRLGACDTVFFLDYDTELCLEGIRNRRGKPRPDLPWIEQKEDSEFVEFIKNFRQSNRPRILELLQIYTDKSIHIFHTREDADAYLRGLRS